MTLTDIVAKQREARRLTIRAALGMTRLKSPSRRAVLLVMLDGYTHAAAGKKTGLLRQNVNKALRIVEPKLKQVEAYILSARSGS